MNVASWASWALLFLVGGLQNAAHGQPLQLGDCIRVSREDVAGANWGDLKPNGVCPMKDAKGNCGDRVIRVTVENRCSKPIKLDVIYGKLGQNVTIDTVAAAKDGAAATKVFRCGEFYDKCRGIAVRPRPDVEPPEERIEMTQEEARRLTAMLKADEYIEEMMRVAVGVAWINRVAEKFVKGPSKLVFKWNKSALDAWKRANEKLAYMSKQSTCRTLDELSGTSPNAGKLFERMHNERGC